MPIKIYFYNFQPIDRQLPLNSLILLKLLYQNFRRFDHVKRQKQIRNDLKFMIFRK